MKRRKPVRIAGKRKVFLWATAGMKQPAKHRKPVRFASKQKVFLLDTAGVMPPVKRRKPVCFARKRTVIPWDTTGKKLTAKAPGSARLAGKKMANHWGITGKKQPARDPKPALYVKRPMELFLRMSMSDVILKVAFPIISASTVISWSLMCTAPNVIGPYSQPAWESTALPALNVAVRCFDL